MKPGIELDRLIAEKVMGIEVVKSENVLGRHIIYTIGRLNINPSGFITNCLPCYSTSIASAWEVVEKFNGPVSVVKSNTEYSCTVHKKMSLVFTAIEKTAPHAICLAVLKSVEYRID